MINNDWPMEQNDWLADWIANSNFTCCLKKIMEVVISSATMTTEILWNTTMISCVHNWF